MFYYLLRFAFASFVCLYSCESFKTSLYGIKEIRRISTRTLKSSTLEEVAIKGENKVEPVSWKCNEDAECVQVPVCNEIKCRTSLDVRIHDTWYDISGFRKAHPAGTHWIEWYDGRDATEVMDAFHSAKGRQMYKRLPKSSKETATMLESSIGEVSLAQRGFRALRNKLELEGWWKRDISREVVLLSIWGGLVIGAAVTARTIPFFSTILLGLAMTNAGWLGHDYVHGVDKFCDRMRYFVNLAAGLGVTWWSDKHNKHHALTNEQGVDEDLATDPFLYTWAPDPKDDSPLRKIQHYIFWIAFSFLFALWRYDTVIVTIDAIKKKRPNAKKELYYLLIHYFFLFTLFPWNVWLPATFLSGFLSSLIVTPTHQDEELFQDFQHDWVTAQLRSTRNAVMTNPFSEWLWGGMQYQLEHHLFPSMPRSKYPFLKPILVEFCETFNIEDGYRESGEFQILKDNWEVYKRVAEADPVEGAPSSRGNGQIGAIDSGSSPAKGGWVN